MRKKIDAFLSDIQKTDYGFNPYISLIQFREFCELAGEIRISGRRCVDFGCGQFRPLTLSSVLYLCGASECSAYELESIKNPAAVAAGIYMLIVLALSGRLELQLDSLGSSQDILKERSYDFDLAKLLSGSLDGVPNSIKHISNAHSSEPFDLLISNSVLEHVSNLDLVLSSFRERISSTGLIYSSIDYRDHRFWSSKGTVSQWLYLFDDGDHSPGYINKIRHEEMTRLFQKHGFAIEKASLFRDKQPPDMRSAILPKYEHLSDEDISITEARLLLRPV